MTNDCHKQQKKNESKKKRKNDQATITFPNT